ncbi:MAG TPA: ribosome recycling factor [Gammaproteobacteria bacterium]|nr:ribosome recycling factor [Gammaproteobacteria bacterium]
MLDEIYKDAQMRMSKTLQVLHNELRKLRTGRASPALVNDLPVSCYGSTSPLNQVANVGVQDPRTLSVTPWDKQLVPAIERAIMESSLGLNPMSAGQVIRIPLPPLTEERRRELAKTVRGDGENTKIALRNIRRDAIGTLRDLLKDKEVSEDDEHRAQDRLQKLTDQNTTEVDAIIATKESEIMEV